MISYLPIGLIIATLLTFFPIDARPYYQDPLPPKVIEVFYFHYTRRCTTCLNVEKETQNAIDQFYPKWKEEGKITFFSVNLEDKSNQALIDRFGISGQTLLITMGDKKSDITDIAFLTVINPEKMRNEVKKAIENLLRN